MEDDQLVPFEAWDIFHPFWDAENPSLAPTTSVAPVRPQHYISELAHKIANKVDGLHVDANELVKSRDAFSNLIKAFSIKLGLESASQTDLDIVHFVHKHHQ